MDDPRVLRIITIGLVLAALAVVYFLFTGGFSVSKPKVSQTQTTKSTPTPSPKPSAVPQVVNQASPAPSATPNPNSAYGTLASRNQGNVQALPRTGFPVGMVVVLSASAIATGLGLRKFPK